MNRHFETPHGKKPFIHALDTSTRSARCIDLDALAGTDLSRLRLKLDSSHELLSVTRGGEPALNVDLRSFRVRPPSSGDTGFPWILALLAALAALLTAAAVPVARRRRHATLAPTQ